MQLLRRLVSARSPRTAASLRVSRRPCPYLQTLTGRVWSLILSLDSSDMVALGRQPWDTVGLTAPYKDASCLGLFLDNAQTE
jgi:hypothetical protein